MTDFSLLESYFIKDGKTYKQYKALNEAEQKQLSKDAITKLFNSIKKKSLKIDYMGIEKTNGDVTKFSKYKDLENAITVLDTMYKQDPQVAPKEINTLVKTLALLKKYKNDFANAFSINNEFVIMMYTNIVAALIGATSITIAASIDYVKDPLGNYKEIFKQHTDLNKDVYIKSLDKFLNLEIKGELKRIINLKKEEDDNEIFSESVFTISMIVLSSVFIAIFAIRDIVFLYYYYKTRIGEKMLMIAYFLEKHANNLDVSKDNYKEVQEKQLKMVEKLRATGDKLLADRKYAEKQADKDKNEEDRNNSNMNSSSNSGDIFI